MVTEVINLILFFFFFFWLHHTFRRISVPWPRIEPWPLHWKPGVLTTRLQGNSQIWYFLNLVIESYKFPSDYCFSYISSHVLLLLWLSWWRIHLQCRRPGFDPWVGKIPWRRERLESPMVCIVCEVANTPTQLNNVHSSLSCFDMIYPITFSFLIQIKILYNCPLTMLLTLDSIVVREHTFYDLDSF